MKQKSKLAFAVIIMTSMVCCGVFCDSSDADSQKTFYYEVGDDVDYSIYAGYYTEEIPTWIGHIPGVQISYGGIKPSPPLVHLITVVGTFTEAGTFVITPSSGAVTVFVVADASEPAPPGVVRYNYAIGDEASGYISGFRGVETWTGSVPGITVSSDINMFQGHGGVYWSGTFTEAGQFTIETSGGVEAIFTIHTPPSVVYDPSASFVFTADGLSVSFTDTSISPAVWQWDFGDDIGTSTTQHPVYTYDEAGTYEVTLTISNASKTSVYVATVQVDGSASGGDTTGGDTTGGDTTGGDTTGEGTTWENIIDDVVDSLNDINDRLGIDHEFTVTEVAVIAGLIIAAIAGLIIAVTRFT